MSGLPRIHLPRNFGVSNKEKVRNAIPFSMEKIQNQTGPYYNTEK